MDAFENLMGMLLRREGYWTATSVKIDIDKAQKRAIGRPSSPRWELDLVAYKGATNEILVVECKSYLDSGGMRFRDGAFDPPERYKLFTEDTLREVVLGTLAAQMARSGACAPNPRITLGLAAAKIAAASDRDGMRSLFDRNGWKLFDDTAIREKLVDAVNSGYENDIGLVAAKILMRESVQ